VLKISNNYKNNDIDKLVDWANKWQLKFNISKYHILHFSKPHGYGEYNIQEKNIKSTDKIKDLGVIIDSNLKFHDHVNSVISIANRILTIIRKTFQFTDNQMFVTLYKTIVRLIIEYGNSVWGPHYIINQQNVEKIKLRTSKSLTGLQDISYSDHLHILNFLSLKYRRLRGDMILVYRLLNNDV